MVGHGGYYGTSGYITIMVVIIFIADTFLKKPLILLLPLLIYTFLALSPDRRKSSLELNYSK